MQHNKLKYKIMTFYYNLANCEIFLTFTIILRIFKKKKLFVNKWILVGIDSLRTFYLTLEL